MGRDAGNAIQIVGLRDLQADLRELDAKLPRELRKVNLSVAQMVAEHAQSTARSQGSVIAKAAPAIRAGADQRSAWVRITATAQLPFALGAEFGAGRNVARTRRSPSGGQVTYTGFKQFQQWRGNGSDAGYALYPTIRGDSDQIVAAYTQRLTELLARVFPD